jgi:hypothetical protein
MEEVNSSMIHQKNFCEWHNGPSPSTTIKKSEGNTLSYWHKQQFIEYDSNSLGNIAKLQMGLHQIKSHLHSKVHNRMKRQSIVIHLPED